MATKKMDAESKKELAFMKRKGAPKAMVKAEMKEEGYAKGGSVFRKAADGIAKRGKTRGTEVKMACGGKVKK